MSERFENIPEELQKRDQWLYWNASADKPRKPLDSPAADYGAAWSDPDEWVSFNEAVESAGMVDTAGIGYVTGKDNDDYARGLYGVIDMDGCVNEDGRPKDWLPSLQPFFDRDAYIEFSPSGEGLHIPIAGFDVPDWWSDKHFSAEEHEGVEALTNKFCTFTGDTLQNSGDEVVDYGGWLDEWLADAYEEITGEDPRSDDPTDGLKDVPDDLGDSGDDDDYSDEWMTTTVAEEALDHINPDITRDDWRDIGFALVGHFGKSAGGALFRNWSRGGSKWDSEAEDQAQRIINDAADWNYSIATVIKHAKSGGWDASAAARKAAVGSRPDDDDSDDEQDNSDDNEGSETADGGESGDDTPPDPGDESDPVNDLDTPITEGEMGLNIRKTTKDGEVYFECLTNFWIDVDAVLERDDGSREYLLTIVPAAAESEYQVAVEPVVFNDRRQFESKVCGKGLSTAYDGSPSDLNRLKEYVAQQDAPIRRGTEHIGLHEDEWVVPDGTLTCDGWTDDPGSVFEAANTPIANKCSLGPDMGADYDTEAVREILRLLPKTRLTERLLPALGWFYAAATRPYVQEWEGEFNILAVTGDTGAGKTATLETLWECFGVGGDLLRADGTTFPKMRALATSNAVPVVFDEYKPADMSAYAVDSFHSLLRTSTRGGIEEKGRPDGSVVGHELLAPAVISGEQALRGTAEERRTLQTNFSRQASVGGTPESKAFTRLTGGDIDGEVVNGYDLTEHALAYYQWILNHNKSELREVWRDARVDAVESIAELGITGLDDMRQQAIQTLVYGCRLYQSFAREMGLGDTPIGDREIERAVTYILNERTSTEHVSNLDRLLELAGRAAAAGYLTRGEQFEIIHEGEPDEELRIKLSLVYDQLRRYARDHDIQDADLLDSDTDYRSRISDASEDDDSYVIETSKQTPGLNRCVAIAAGDAETDIEGFEMALFRGDTSEEAEDTEEGEETPGFDLTSLDPSRSQPVIFQATVTSVLEPAPWLQGEGILQDDSGVARFIARGNENPATDIDEGERVEIRDAMVTTNEDGAPVVEFIDGLTTIESAASPSQQSGLNQAATTDGGEPMDVNVDNLIPKAITYVRTNEGADPVEHDDLVSYLRDETGVDVETAEGVIENCLKQGKFREPATDEYRCES